MVCFSIQWILQQENRMPEKLVAMSRAGAVFCAFLALPFATLMAQEAEAGPESAFRSLRESAGSRSLGSFPFDYQQLAYRRGTGDSTQLWAAVNVDAGRVRSVFQGGWKYALGMRFELFRGDERVAVDSFQVQHTLNRVVPTGTGDGFPLQTAVEVLPGRYRYRIEVTDYNWERLPATNSVSGDITVPRIDRSAGGPVVSSIAIASDTAGNWRPREGVGLKLNAARIVRQNARPYIYYEVYGLTPGGEYRGEVRLVSTWASRGQGETFVGARQPFQLQYRGTAPLDGSLPVEAALRLDLSRTRPGPYEVKVRITDLTTGRVSAMRRAVLKVLPPREREPATPITEVDDG